MINYSEYEAKIHSIIDSIQGICSTVGLSNSANEEVVVTQIFLYKFLNEKCKNELQKYADKHNKTMAEIVADDTQYSRFKRNLNYASNVFIPQTSSIDYIKKYYELDTFYEYFDNAMLAINNEPVNSDFLMEDVDGNITNLFEPISTMVQLRSRNNFMKNLFNTIADIDFSELFNSSFDFFSSIFEYLIKNYNVASGTYAEYYTPQAIASIIGKILVGNDKLNQDVEIYDAAAGSGSLILHLAHELDSTSDIYRSHIYTQDISQKSNRFLRLNMILNNKSEAKNNIIQGDTLLFPAHYTIDEDHSSGLKNFDYITINPPFKMDFSATRNTIKSKWDKTTRFFAGVPNIPANKKDSMAIYLLFIQHALYSLKDNGKAAIVVPTGFITAKSGIELKIRQKMIDDGMLKGVISMPSNIFANTGTNVSVLFLDKANTSREAFFMDASKLGTKVKEKGNQRTVLSDEEIQRIIGTFLACESVEDLAVKVSYDDIIEKGYSFSAGQYFEVKIEYVDISEEDFLNRMNAHQERLSVLFSEGKSLEEEIQKKLGELKYGNS